MFSAPALANGTATSAPFSTPEASGSHAIVATYGGDDNFLSSASAPLTDTAATTAAGAYVVFQNTTLTIGAPGVLGDDTPGSSGRTLTAVLRSGPTMASGPATGSLTLNADGSFSYTPAPSDGVVEVTFTYAPYYGTLYGPDTIVRITVLDPAAPPAVVAVNDAYSVSAGGTLTVEAPGLLANDQSLTLTVQAVVSGPKFGTLTLNPAGGPAKGGFTYTPAPGFTGVDSFFYRATDGTGVSNLAMVTMASM